MAVSVLIVDDEPDITAGLMVHLTAAGYDVKHAINGLAGVEAARVERPDVIVLDIRMPDIDGTEVRRRLQATPDLAHIPVVYLSANVPENVVEQGCTFDGCFYLSKPYEVDDVIRAIELVVKKSKKHAAQGT